VRERVEEELVMHVGKESSAAGVENDQRIAMKAQRIAEAAVARFRESFEVRVERAFPSSSPPHPALSDTGRAYL
jgi:hypothetical protein